MRLRVTLFCILALVLAFPLPFSRATNQSDYLSIFLKFNDANQLERQGDYRGALEDYEDCYARLQKLHSRDPDWEPALVIPRMRDCQAKISELTDKAQAQPVSPSVSTGTTPSPEANPLTGMPTDVATLQQQLIAVKQQLKDTEEKLHNSEIEAQTYRSQLDLVNQQLAALKSQQSMDDKVGQLLSQNKVLTDQLAEAKKELTSLKSPNPKSALALLRAQLKNTQDELAQSQYQNTALQQTTTTLKQQLDQAQADLSIANQKLAAAPAGSPEYDRLKRENEIMRGILQRELQEQARRDAAKRLAQEEFDRLKINSKVLQEQFDIATSPTTPPTTDEERALLESLKVPGIALQEPDNGTGFSASNAGAPATPPDTTTNAPAATPTPPAPDNTTASGPTTNAAPAVTETSGTNAPAAETPATTNAPSATMETPATHAPAITTVETPSTNAAMAADTPTTHAAPTNSETSTSPASPTNAATTDTNAPGMSTASSGTDTSANPPVTVMGTTNVSSSDTNTPATNAVATDTNPPPAAPVPPSTTNVAASTPPAPDTTGAGTNAAPSTPDSGNTPTVTQLPPSTTTYSDTTIQNNGNTSTSSTPAQPDPTQFSQKPRLPDDMRDTAQQAADLFKMEHYDEAAAKYQTIIDKYPESLYAWSNLGVVRFQQGNFDEALRALQQAVKLSPTDAFSYSNLGIVYYQLNQYENAIAALERALALDPNDAKSHNYLGCACSQKGWQEVAEKEFLKAIALDDSFGDAHFNLALVYATEKPPSIELAKRHYNRALELGIAKDSRLEKLLQE